MQVKKDVLAKVCLTLAIIIFLFFSFWFRAFTIDDAYISFRYSENFINGKGLTWNIGDDPVEGYSNFLWVLVAAVILKLGIPIEAGIKTIGVILQLANLGLIYKIAQHLTKDNLWSSFVVLLTAITPAFSFWAIGGLENPLFMFFFYLGVYLFFKELERPQIPYSSVAFALSAMTRHEGAVLFVLSLIYRVVASFSIEEGKLKVSKDNLKVSVIAAFLFGIIYTPYFVWRWNFYGYFFPNTYYAKIARGAGWSEIWHFVKYFWPFLLMALPSLFAMKGDKLIIKPTRGAVFLWLVAILSTLTLVNRNPIMGNYYRFFLHFIPFIYLLCVPLWKSIVQHKKEYALVLIIMLLLPIEVTKIASDHQTYMTYARGMKDAHITLGNWIEKETPRDATIAITDAGAVPFFSKRRTIDLWGLNNEYLAHNGFDIEYFWSERPDVITLFSVSTERFGSNYAYEYQIFQSEKFQKEYELARIDSWKGSDYHLLTFTKKALGLAPKSAQ